MENPRKLYVCAACAKMPQSCRGRYGRVALVLSADGSVPLLIADTKNCTVIASWERLNVGRTSRCALGRAMREARQLAAECAEKYGYDYEQRLLTDVEFKHYSNQFRCNSAPEKHCPKNGTRRKNE